MTSLIKSLNYLWIPGNETIFKNINKLSPGNYIELHENGVFNEKIILKLNEEKLIYDEDSAYEKTLNTINNSIKRHMVSDVEVSSFLSGGLDSSLISVLAKNYNQNLSTYTIGTNKRDKVVEQMPDDEKYARKLAVKYKFNHNEIVINPDITKLLPKIVYHLDEPIGDPAAINTYLICSSLKSKGQKVILSGMGADEIFLGYRRQKALIYAQSFKKITIFRSFDYKKNC